MLLACHLKNQSFYWIIITPLNWSLYFYHWLWIILNTEADHVSHLLKTLHCHPILLRVCSLQNSVIRLFFLLCIILSFLLIGPAELSPGCISNISGLIPGRELSSFKIQCSLFLHFFQVLYYLLNMLMEKTLWIIAALSAMHTS